jgi:hypothetical protein
VKIRIPTAPSGNIHTLRPSTFIGELERLGIVDGGRLARPVAAAWRGLAGDLIGAGKRS